MFCYTAFGGVPIKQGAVLSCFKSLHIFWYLKLHNLPKKTLFHSIKLTLSNIANCDGTTKPHKTLQVIIMAS